MPTQQEKTIGIFPFSFPHKCFESDLDNNAPEFTDSRSNERPQGSQGGSDSNPALRHPLLLATLHAGLRRSVSAGLLVHFRDHHSISGERTSQCSHVCLYFRFLFDRVSAYLASFVSPTTKSIRQSGRSFRGEFTRIPDGATTNIRGRRTVRPFMWSTATVSRIACL